MPGLNGTYDAFLSSQEPNNVQTFDSPDLSVKPTITTQTPTSKKWVSTPKQPAKYILEKDSELTRLYGINASQKDKRAFEKYWDSSDRLAQEQYWLAKDKAQTEDFNETMQRWDDWMNLSQEAKLARHNEITSIHNNLMKEKKDATYFDAVQVYNKQPKQPNLTPTIEITGEVGKTAETNTETNTTTTTTTETPKTLTTTTPTTTTTSTTETEETEETPATTVTDDVFNGLSANDAALLKKAREHYPFTSLEEVKLYQRMLGVNPDGDFGQNTIAAMKNHPNMYTYWTDRAVKFGFKNIVGVRDWQKANGVANPDGQFGPSSEQLYNQLKSMTEKKQQGGTIDDVQAQVRELVNKAAEGDKNASDQIQQIVEAAKQGNKEALQLLQLIQQEIQSRKKLRRGAKLNYLKSLKGQCLDGEEIVYFKKGGKTCKKCEKVNKNQIGGSLLAPLAIRKAAMEKVAIDKDKFKKFRGPLGAAGAAGASAAGSVGSNGKVYDGGMLPEVVATPVYDGGTLPEFTVQGKRPIYNGGTLPEFTITRSYRR